MDHTPLYLMDGTAFVYRGFYANQSMQRSDGFPTSALFIVARILLRLLREKTPSHFVFVLDGKGTNFRHELFPMYKAQRKSTPEELVRQLEPIRELVKALGLTLEVSEGCEADDCIASLARRFRDTRPVVIVSGDKDLRQCLAPDVVLWDPAAKEEKLFTLERFTAETGLLPDQWADMQAVIGDASDNIPGIPGVGPKTAAKLFAEYPTLEAIRDHVDALPPSLKKKFDGQLEAMFLYRQLTRLDTSQCAHLSLADMAVRPVNREAAATLFREYELNSLERELALLIRDGKVAATDSGRSDSGRLDSGRADGAGLATGGGGRGSGSVQLSLLDTPRAETRPVCASVADLPDWSGCTVAVMPDVRAEYAGRDDAPFEWALAADGREWLYCGPVAPLVAHLATAAQLVTPDVKALLRMQAGWAAVPPARWFDLGLAAYLLNPEERDYAWPRLSGRYSVALGLPQGNPGLLALAISAEFARRLAGAHLTGLMTALELPLIPVLADMEAAGVLVDAAALEAFLTEVQRDLERLTAEVYAAAGGPFNIRSAQQLGDVLFNRLQLPAGGKTRGGQMSTDQDTLEKLSGRHPVVDALLEFRKLEKLRSTYLEPLPRLMGADGRVRTTFNQLATATGRLSSSNPNLQNIPVRGPMGQRMRACFTAPAGRLLVSADYSQIELRVLAHYAQDPTLLAAFREGADIHSRTAALLYDAAPGEVTPEQRRSAKTINFGLIYGMGANKLAGELGIGLAEARAFMARYFERLGGLKRFYETVEEQARQQGYVTTLAGRRRLLPDISSESPQQQALARRQAINTLIQGSAADIIKLAMLAVHADPELQALDARLLLQVHDELLLEVPEAQADRAGERLARLMADIRPGGVQLDVPLVAEWGAAPSWGDAH